MLNLAELRQDARKAAIEVTIGTATAVAAALALQAIDAGREKAPEPVRIEIVLPAQTGADTTITLRGAMDIKRFPARPHAPIRVQAVPKQKAMPMLLK